MSKDLLQEYKSLMKHPEADVYCYTCGYRIYRLKRMPLGCTSLDSSYFVPVLKGIGPPVTGTSALCPMCGMSFLGPCGELLIEEEPNKEYKIPRNGYNYEEVI